MKLLAAGIALGLLTLTACAPQALETRTLTPCAQEDSDNCYWDAAHRGNGQGTSFITLDGVIYYPKG